MARISTRSLPCPAGVLRRASTITLDPAIISRPESIEFPTTRGRIAARAGYYPLTNLERLGSAVAEGSCSSPPTEASRLGRPDLARSGRKQRHDRGIAVVDVDYGGSTGYGRDYRRRLDSGHRPTADVSVAAARFLVERVV